MIELLGRVDRSEKFLRLFAEGDTGGYASPSEADAALAAKLAWGTRDRSQIKRLMRQSALARDKYQRDDYLDRTIDGALGFVQDYYDWNKPPTIVVTTDEHKVIDQAVKCLPREPGLFQRGSLLSHVITGAPKPRGVKRPDDAPRIAPVRHARLREILAATANWMQPTDNGLVPCHVPCWAVEPVAARETWPGLRPLEGVVEVPILRADGTVVETPGYDVKTGLVYRPSRDYPPVSQGPNQDDARRAVDLLAETVIDFPFANHAHFAAWIAAALTPFARYAFCGPAPLFLVDANTAGTGKGLFVQCCQSNLFRPRNERRNRAAQRRGVS